MIDAVWFSDTATEQMTVSVSSAEGKPGSGGGFAELGVSALIFLSGLLFLYGSRNHPSRDEKNF